MNERKLGVQNTMRERERRGEKEREREQQQPVVLVNRKEMTNNERPLANK